MLKNNIIFWSFSFNFTQFHYFIENLKLFSNSLPNRINPRTLEKEFASSFMFNHTSKTKIFKFNNVPKFFNISMSENLFVLKSFKTYMKINIYGANNFKVHGSFFTHYLTFMSSNTSVISVKKFFNFYKNIFFFITNIFYYQIPLLSFGSSSFKKELLSLNWSYLSNFNFVWRYTRPFLCLTSNKIRDNLDLVFKALRRLNFHTALILDVFYHAKTIHYLNKTGFYSFGLVPINMNRYLVNFAIPTSHEGALSQVFLIRFILSSKKQTETHIFNEFFSNWNFFKNLMMS